MTPVRDWQVLLIGGASAAGKTAVRYRLAHYFGSGLTEVGDFQALLETMTTPEQQPVLHFLSEADEQQLLANFSQREPAGGHQTKRARLSWLFNRCLELESGPYGLPVLPARPWSTVFDRIVAALS